jgi:mannose-6-phosphate isomerase-like protein (cupin superfamily)
VKVIRGSEVAFIPASHEDATNPAVWKRVLATRDDMLDGRVQMLNWARIRPAAAFRRHYHENMQEVFVIVRGAAIFTVDGVQLQLCAGDAVIVECLEAHTMENSGDTDLEYICFGISASPTGKTILS